MGSQRFCLRWNNHQTNLLSVFDQLLHEEAFVDVTLAVEGQFLRAHKMVLSACSPYFQALFVGHPDKHPIVILKDVPYSDMRSLLDFMYRGEVSVDQDRLTAFLKVAESLRIKGLTEVNEERCDLPSIANSLLNQTLPPPPPPSLHRLPMPPSTQHKRPPPNQMLNSALTAPKRKRGRPRKLSGSAPNTPHHPLPDLDHGDQKLQQPVPAIENHLGASSPSSFPQMPVPQPHSLQTNSIPLPEIPAVNFRSCLPPPVPPTGLSQASCTPHQPTFNISNPPANEELESPKIEDEEEDDFEGVQKVEDGDEEMGLDEDEPQDTEHHKIDDPKPSTSGQDSLASYQSSTQSEGERFSSSGYKTEPAPLEFTEAEDTSNIMACFDDLIDYSPTPSDIEENVEAEFSSHTTEPEFVDDDISQFEEDSFRSLLGKLPDTDSTRRRIDKMSIRKFCLREGDQVHRCTICSKAYTHVSNFCRHFLSAHCGAKQEVHCPFCSKAFTRKDNMMTHAKQVHGLC